MELQKIFLLLRFFNQISCNKGLKAKISCFCICFLCLTPPLPRPKCSRIRKTASFLTSHRLRKNKNQHPWSFTNGAKSVVNVERHQFLRKIANFYQLSEWNENIACFYYFFILEIFKFKYDKLFVRHSASISKFEWFEQPWSLDPENHILCLTLLTSSRKLKVGTNFVGSNAEFTTEKLDGDLIQILLQIHNFQRIIFRIFGHQSRKMVLNKAKKNNKTCLNEVIIQLSSHLPQTGIKDFSISNLLSLFFSRCCWSSFLHKSISWFSWWL